jgi:hypothetical protein
VALYKDGQRLAVGVADGVGGSRSDDDPETLVAGECVAHVCMQVPSPYKAAPR